jgi:hypothetical protein
MQILEKVLPLHEATIRRLAYSLATADLSGCACVVSCACDNNSVRSGMCVVIEQLAREHEAQALGSMHLYYRACCAHCCVLLVKRTLRTEATESWHLWSVVGGDRSDSFAASSGIDDSAQVRYSLAVTCELRDFSRLVRGNGRLSGVRSVTEARCSS